MIKFHTRNFDLHITVPSPNLAFLCRNLAYKPYSINQSIINTTTARDHAVLHLHYNTLGRRDCVGLLNYYAYLPYPPPFYNVSPGLFHHAWDGEGEGVEGGT